MKKLLKQHGLNSDMQYFELIVYKLKQINKQAAIYAFLELPKVERVRFITSALTNWNSGLTNEEISYFVEYIYWTKK